MLATASAMPEFAYADESPSEVYFAGFGYLCRDDQVASRFPWTSRVIGESGDEALNGRLGARAKSFASPAFRLNVDGLGKLRPGENGRVLALVFDRELISHEKVAGDWKTRVEISFQALIFDFSTQNVVTAVPMGAEYVFASQAPAGDEDIAGIFRRLLLGDQDTAVQPTFWRVLGTAGVLHDGQRTLRILSSTIAEPAQTALTASDNPAGLGPDALAQRFAQFLCARQQLPLLPFAGTQAVNGVMPTKISNGVVYNLKIPEPDYAISLRLDGLKKVKASETGAGVVWVYGAFITIRFYEPLSDRSFFDAQVKLGATRTVPTTMEQIDDGAAFAEVVTRLFNEFAGAIQPFDAAWAEKHIVAAQSRQPRMDQLKELISACR